VIFVKKFGKILAYVAVVLLSLGIVGCSASKNISMSKDTANNNAAGTASGGGYTQNALGDNVSTQRKLIVTSTIDLETKKFDTTIDDINKACVVAGGFIESSNVQGKRIGEDQPRNADYTFRVPTDKLNSFKAAVKKTGNVITDNVASEDVTGDYIDTDGRLTTAKAHRDSLLKLANNTSNVTDLIELEKEIATVQTEIEQLSTNLKKWDSLTALSTVKITVNEVDAITIKSVTPKSFWGKIGDSFSSSISFITTVSQGLLIVLTFLSPYIAVAIVVLLIVFYFRKRAKKQKN
jgi:uncharacterized small protein (DUF1192 family)